MHPFSSPDGGGDPGFSTTGLDRRPNRTARVCLLPLSFDFASTRFTPDDVHRPVRPSPSVASHALVVLVPLSPARVAAPPRPRRSRELASSSALTAYTTMATTSSKGLPSGFDHFIHGTPYSNHRDLNSATRAPTSSSSSASHSFRRAWPTPSGGTDEDFGAFLDPRHDPWRPSPAPSTSRIGSGPPPPSATRASQQDGFEIQALLGSHTLNDAIHADWETTLQAEQDAAWAGTATMPSDPLISRQGLVDRKGKGRGATTPSSPGNVSPTSSALLSSLSSMDLSSRTYLKSLLSLQDPTAAIEDYFAQGTYSDDVWGLPEGVRGLLEKTRQGAEEGKEAEEGRKKAVRRLGMVVRHLWGAGGEGDAVGELGRTTEGGSTLGGRVDDYGFAQEFARSQQDSSMEASRTADSTSQQQGQQPITTITATHSGLQHVNLSHHAVFSSASPLSRPPLHPTHTHGSSRSLFSPYASPLHHGHPPPQSDDHDDGEDDSLDEPPLTPFSAFMEEKLESMRSRTPTGGRSRSGTGEGYFAQQQMMAEGGEQ